MLKNTHQEEGVPKKRKTKKSHKLYAFVVLLLGFAIIALALLILFYVQEIKVKGNEYCTDQEIVDTVKSDQYSINTLYILGKYALGYGDTLPCLDEMKISLTAPWALKVTVKEKPIVGYVYAGDQYAYFDKDGLIVSVSSDFIEGLPYIEGVDVGDVKLYNRLKSSDADIFQDILATSREVTKYGLNTDKITCKDDQIYLSIGTVSVNLGNQISSEQIAQIPPIIERLAGQTGTLHLEKYSEGKETIRFTIEEPEAAGEDEQSGGGEDDQPEEGQEGEPDDQPEGSEDGQ